MIEFEQITEPELVVNMTKYLSKFFTVTSEVWSTDGKRRIDMIIIHHSDIQKKYPIGLELKSIDKKRGKNLAEWLKQAHDYSLKEFRGFGKCLIITCPQVSGYFLNEGDLMNKHEPGTQFCQANNVSTFLSQFGVGEFQKYIENDKPYFQIVFSGQIIWSSKRNDLRANNYERLCLK
jgi:hypothetical protein